MRLRRVANDHVRLEPIVGFGGANLDQVVAGNS